jgi:hypothetical protein
VRIEGFRKPDWESVLARQGAFQDWAQERLVLDSMQPLANLVDAALAYLT